MTERRPDSEETIEKILELTKLSFAFGKVKRAIYHDDGNTIENDAEHTVMLGIMACAFAKEFAPELDRGRIAEFSLVHDLVEVYAGDTVSFKVFTAQEKKEKAEREHAAFERIKREYDGVFPWIGETIEEYETLASPEACYVKFFDKVLPKLTHILNEGKMARELGHDLPSTEAFHKEQIESIVGSYGKEHSAVEKLYRAIALRMQEKAFMQ